MIMGFPTPIEDVPPTPATIRRSARRSFSTFPKTTMARLRQRSSSWTLREKSSDEKIREKEANLAAIEPGMNRLQWDLRYPYATEVTGYDAPIAAGGLEDSVHGPVVAPGTYSVVLEYGGQKMQQNFTVSLDPRLHARPQDLAARLALDLQIHADLDSLDKDINQALAARDKLQKAVSTNGLTSAQAGSALTALNGD